MLSTDNAESFKENSVIDDMGAMFIIGLGLLFLIGMTFLFTAICKNKNGCCIKLVNKIKAKLLWNSVIRYSLQSYLKLAFANFAALTTIRWGTFSNVMLSLFTSLTSFILAILPFYYALHLKNLEKLK